MKPNVLILHADQHRQDCIGAYGNRDVQTPAIDALAADGVRYENHYTVYPVCTPSRYSLVSGLYTHQHCAWTNESTLPSGFATFPRLLAAEGFCTAAVGKMHMTPTYQDVGYQSLCLAEQNGEGRYEDDYHAYLKADGLVDAVDLIDQVDEIRAKASQAYFDCFGAAESDLDCAHHSTSWITRQAKRELEGWSADGGNLLMVGYVKPHHPFDPPYPYSTMYDPARLTIPGGYTASVPEHDYRQYRGFFDSATLSEERLRRALALYYGAITQIDDNIAELIALLKSRGMYDNTMIVFTSDHGDYMGYHHMLLKGNFLYEPLAKIPLIIKYPGQRGAADVSDALCENIDLATTILSCCGVDAPPQMQGVDLAACGAGREFAFSEGQYGTAEQPCFGYMVRSRRYKLIVHGSLENAMFFDFENDPYELENLIGDPVYAAEIRRHRDFLVDKLLFRSAGVNHVDKRAPVVGDRDAPQQRAEALRPFIEQKLPGILKTF